MDTSNNQSTSQNTELRINVIDYLFGSTNKKILTTSLSPETWVKAIRRLISESRPYLKYFNGYKEVMDKHSCPGFVYEGTKITYSDGVTSKTRIMPITKRGDGLGYWDKNKFITEQLYMSDSGMILLFTTYTTSKKRSGTASEVKDEHFCDITIVSDSKLTDLVRRSHGRIIDLLECFHEVLDAGIKGRQKQINALNEVLLTVDRWRDSIEMEVLCEVCGKNKTRFGSCPNGDEIELKHNEPGKNREILSKLIFNLREFTENELIMAFHSQEKTSGTIRIDVSNDRARTINQFLDALREIGVLGFRFGLYYVKKRNQNVR